MVNLKKTKQTKMHTQKKPNTKTLNIENKLGIFQSTVHHISAFEIGNASVSPISQMKKLKGFG